MINFKPPISFYPVKFFLFNGVLFLSILIIFTACRKLEYDKNLTFQEMKANMPETLDENLVEKHLVLSGGWEKMPDDSFSFTNMTHANGECFGCPIPTGYDTFFNIYIQSDFEYGDKGYIYFEAVRVLPNDQIKFNLPFYDPSKSVNRVGIKLFCSDSIFVLQRNDLMGQQENKNVTFSINIDNEIYNKIIKTCYQIPFEIYAIRQNGEMVCRSFSFVWLKNGQEADPACANEPHLDDLIGSNCEGCPIDQLRWRCF